MNLNQFMVALLRADESCVTKRHQRLKQSSGVGTAGVSDSCDDTADSEELHTAFHVFDANSDGFIDASELRSAMHELTGDTLTDADVDAMIHSADRDGDGQINYEGIYIITIFVNIFSCTKLAVNSSFSTVEVVMYCNATSTTDV